MTSSSSTTRRRFCSRTTGTPFLDVGPDPDPRPLTVSSSRVERNPKISYLWMGLCPSVNQPMPNGIADQLRGVLQPQLRQYVRAVVVDRFHAEAEVGGDGAARLSLAQAEEDLELARREQIVPAVGVAGVALHHETLAHLVTDVPAPGGQAADRADQLLRRAALLEVTRRAAAQRAKGELLLAL